MRADRRSDADGRPNSIRRRASARALLDAEYLVVWLVALVVVAGVAGAVVEYGDEVRDTTPEADFAVSFDQGTRTLTVTHAGGDAIRDRVTRRLSVVVVDASNGTTERVDWARDGTSFSDRGTGYPVTAGDSLSIDDPAVDADGDNDYHDAAASVGFHLSVEDTVRVEWHGVRRSGQTTTLTLLHAALVSDDGTIRFETGE